VSCLCITSDSRRAIVVDTAIRTFVCGTRSLTCVFIILYAAPSHLPVLHTSIRISMPTEASHLPLGDQPHALMAPSWPLSSRTFIRINHAVIRKEYQGHIVLRGH
jgi:hypothetical protein